MVNNGYNREMAIDVVATGRADLVSFGRLFIANPDLVERLSENGPLNALMEQKTLYGGGAHGYTDYPPSSKLAHRQTCRAGHGLNPTRFDIV